MTVRLLAFAGSTRAGSHNQALVDLAAAEARAQGAEVTSAKLKDFALPLYDADLEREAFPAAALELKALFVSHHGFLIASPEYNGSISGVLKNAIDWVSRPTAGDPPGGLPAFRGKVAGIMATSISPFGGVRSLAHLRQILSTIQTIVATEQVMVPLAHSAFDEATGALKEALPAQLLSMMTARVIDLARRLSA
ncbi:MAG TPA: NAD(P)H-dependent oxidoreductase [Caulobacteraceae bacterium]|nr:NAD(P)H-dependent oxidoreductase [Caulobacteraceae bacterium]